jgi:hypothetical protein
MVDGQILGFARSFVRRGLRLVADGADTALGVQHLLVALSVDASVHPFALLGVMRMAKVFGVKVIVAITYHADTRRLFAVSVFGVAVTQEALVVGLA